MADGIEELEPSELGSKEHWDKAYEREYQIFISNPLDEGVIWFEESGAEGRILSYLSKQNLAPTSSFLDLGTGNGHLLFELVDSGDYEGGAMLGIDYSPAAVELAAKIAAERGVADRVRFEVVDVIKSELSYADGFDVVLDKGTYDAISLSAERLEDGRRIYADYPRKVAGTVRHHGLFIITSCNWTEEEIKKTFDGQNGLRYHGSIQYPTFSFGGRTGQPISSVCFQKA